MAHLPASSPSPVRSSRVLKDGIWDRCEWIETLSGEPRVRKTTKGTGPWGVNTLRAEIQYLLHLPPGLAESFPSVLAAWGLGLGDREVGYEMPYFDGWRDLGDWIRSGKLFQRDADALQDGLAELVFTRLHRADPGKHALASHIEDVLRDALAQLDRDPEFSALIRAEEIVLNGHAIAGPGRAFQRLVANGDLFRALAQAPSFRLHGDLLHENILWRPDPPAGRPALVLLDPVSVAGVYSGPPLFDLVKYESYATGELYALRAGKVDACRVEDAAPGRPACRFRIQWEHPELRPFRLIDLHSRFRAAYTARHGAHERALYRLIDAYFALVMAMNTQGLLRWARVLKGAECLAQAVAR
ncbi:MAG: hypothetical protein KIS92_10565 [Planctomycetota bacterium]|nr:hypothetical protein [Planctomycetota bacterium]